MGRLKKTKLEAVENSAAQIKTDGTRNLSATEHSYELPAETTTAIKQEKQIAARLDSVSGEINNLTKTTKERISSLGNGTAERSSVAENRESSAERERVMEGFQEKRGGIITKPDIKKSSGVNFPTRSIFPRSGISSGIVL